MFLCSLIVRPLHPCLFYYTCFTSTADCATALRSTAGAQDLGNYVTHNVTWYSTSAIVCTVLKTQASTESNHHGTNILVVKHTVHKRLKEIYAKATVIALASFDVGRLKKSLKEEEEEEEEEER